MIVLRNVEMPEWSHYFSITFESIDETQQETTEGLVHEEAEDIADGLMEELAKAHKTINELMEINADLGADNNTISKARQRIIELEDRLKKSKELNEKYQRKLTNRKEIVKDALREVLEELLEALKEE